jgi:hypothetical protein
VQAMKDSFECRASHRYACRDEPIISAIWNREPS